MLRRATTLRRRFGRDRRGVATIEIALMLPLLGVLLIGSVEFVTYSWAIGRVHDASATVGDLVSRNSTINQDQIGGIFQAADVVIEGDQSVGAASALEVEVVSALSCWCDVDEETMCYYALWSHRYSGGATTNGVAQGTQILAIPSDLSQQENENIIYTTVSYAFDPDVNLVLPDTMYEMFDQSFFRPRRSNFVEHTGNQETDTPVDCSNIEDEFGITLGT